MSSGTALAPLPCVDPDGPWQKLQLHLRSARAAREVGDVTLALQEVDAALSIDPDYLAARFLRESIANPEPAPRPFSRLPFNHLLLR